MKTIPLCLPDIDADDEQALLTVLRSGQLAHGPCNTELEAMFCRLTGAPYAVSVNSCASALFLALKAAGITGEVILPSFTFVASANAVVAAGAVPVFADIDPRTYCIDPHSVHACVTPLTEAIMCVHFAGQMADAATLSIYAEHQGLLLIEDSAEAIGATCDGHQAGSLGVGCFSFYPTKNITTGEGGMITTHKQGLATCARELSAHGVAPLPADRPWRRSAHMPGYNMRLSNLAAALGVSQMRKLDTMTTRRRLMAELYGALLDPDLFVLPYVRPGHTHVYQMYCVRLKAGNRDEFVKRLRADGIGASVHFDPPVHEHQAYRRFCRRALPVTDQVAASIVTLPCYSGMQCSDVEYVATRANAAAQAITLRR